MTDDPIFDHLEAFLVAEKRDNFPEGLREFGSEPYNSALAWRREDGVWMISAWDGPGYIHTVELTPEEARAMAEFILKDGKE